MLEVEKKELRAALDDLTIHFTRIEMEKEAIRDSIEALAEKYDLSKRMLNKLARLIHQQNAQEEFEKSRELEQVYEELMLNA